jgi:hypothetical protein
MYSLGEHKPDLNCWSLVSDAVRTGKLEPDPLRQLLGTLIAGGEAYANEICAQTFKEVLRKYPNLIYCHQNRVPAFEVFGFLRTSELSLAVSEFLKLAHHGQDMNSPTWWGAFFNSMTYRVRGDGRHYYDDRLEAALPELTREAIALPLSERQMKHLQQSRSCYLSGSEASRKGN